MKKKRSKGNREYIQLYEPEQLQGKALQVLKKRGITNPTPDQVNTVKRQLSYLKKVKTRDHSQVEEWHRLLDQAREDGDQETQKRIKTKLEERRQRIVDKALNR